MIPIIDGIVELARQGGKIQLVASPKLTEQDIQAIELGYQKREETIKGVFTKDFSAEINSLDDDQLKLLASLIEVSRGLCQKRSCFRQSSFAVFQMGQRAIQKAMNPTTF